MSLGLQRPHALAIAPNGDLYVTDNSQRVSVISPDGKVLRRWGKLGDGLGEFRFILKDAADVGYFSGKIAVGSNGMVYVSDSGNHRIQVFTPQGGFVRQLGSFGSGKGEFLRPQALVVDAAGNVYVTDDDLGAVSEFSPTGRFLWRIGGQSSDDPDLIGHLYVTSLDRHMRLVMANDEKHRIVYVDRGGHKVDAFGGEADFPGGSCDVTVDAMGYTYVNSCGPQAVATEVFDRTHTLIGQWSRTDDPLAFAPRFGPNGEVFALGWDDSVIGLRITFPKG